MDKRIPRKERRNESYDAGGKCMREPPHIIYRFTMARPSIESAARNWNRSVINFPLTSRIFARESSIRYHQNSYGKRADLLSLSLLLIRDDNHTGV